MIKNYYLFKRILKENRFLWVAIVLAFLFLLSLAPFLVTSHSYEEQTPHYLAGPSFSFLLGTDELGRDNLARLLLAVKISFTVSIVATLISAFLGLVFGYWAASKNNAVSTLIRRTMDVIYGIPDLLLMILIGAMFGQNIFTLILGLSLFGWISLARFVQAETSRLLSTQFVEGAKALGLSDIQIFIRHILPLFFRSYLILFLFKIPQMIIAESSLSFIGLGLKPPLASFGTLALDGIQGLRFYPQLVLLPSILLILIISGLQFLGRRLSSKDLSTL